MDLRKYSTLFAKLYVASQSRGMDVKENVSYKNSFKLLLCLSNFVDGKRIVQ